MTDLTNVWPAWGEVGSLPPIGFFYEGGDRVNEKHLDALWDNLNKEWQEMIDGVTDRTKELAGNVVLDEGLVTTDGGNTDINISASNAGAYVNGQKTGSITADTVSLSTNGTASTRTDTVQVSRDGIISANEGSTSADSNKMKIAEVDVSTSNTISEIRDYVPRNTLIRTQDEIPDAPLSGKGIWIDESEETFNVWFSSVTQWEQVNKTRREVQEDAIIWSEGFAPNFAG